MLKNSAVNSTALEILQGHDIAFAGLFGSRAKGKERPDSDYDFLIEFSSGKKYTLLDIAGLKLDLENTLGKQVDVITTKALHPYIKKSVYSDLDILYDHR